MSGNSVLQPCQSSTPESIEWFIEDLAFPLSYDLTPHPPRPPPPVSNFSLFLSIYVWHQKLSDKRGVGGKVRSQMKWYESWNAWSSINHSILAGRPWHCSPPLTSTVMPLLVLEEQGQKLYLFFLHWLKQQAPHGPAVDAQGMHEIWIYVEYCTPQRIEEFTQQVVFLFPKLRGGWFMWILYCSCMSRQYTVTPIPLPQYCVSISWDKVFENLKNQFFLRVCAPWWFWGFKKAFFICFLWNYFLFLKVLIKTLLKIPSSVIFRFSSLSRGMQ